MLDFAQLAQQCAPSVHGTTLAHLVAIESAYNPYAIGVVGAHLERQPRTLGEAVATAQWLSARQFNYSVGLGQINQGNFAKYALSISTAFEPCDNLRAAAAILTECYLRAHQRRTDEQGALRDALSCYYSGNFTTGYTAGYVLKVIQGPARHSPAASSPARAAPSLSEPPAVSTSALMF